MKKICSILLALLLVLGMIPSAHSRRRAIALRLLLLLTKTPLNLVKRLPLHIH